MKKIKATGKRFNTIIKGLNLEDDHIYEFEVCKKRGLFSEWKFLLRVLFGKKPYYTFKERNGE